MKQLIGLTLAACLFCLPAMTSAAGNPHIDPQAEPTHDGLYRLKKAKFDAAWIRPEVDLSGYTKLWVQGAGLAFRPVEGGRSTYAARSGRDTEFPITEKNQKKLQKVMREIFIDELGKMKRYTLVDAAGPDVLILIGGVIDVISKVPPEPIGRSRIYLSSVGEATLVLELRDSESKAVLVRVADRRAAASHYMQEANSVSSWSEVRTLSRNWARLIVKRLNEVVGASQGVVEKE